MITWIPLWIKKKMYVSWWICKDEFLLYQNTHTHTGNDSFRFWVEDLPQKKNDSGFFENWRIGNSNGEKSPSKWLLSNHERKKSLRAPTGAGGKVAFRKKKDAYHSHRKKSHCNYHHHQKASGEGDFSEKKNTQKKLVCVCCLFELDWFFFYFWK